MPLRAIKGDVDVLAYAMTDNEWSELKKHYRSSGMHMPCCQSRAIPKTSKNGTHFFAHQARGECTSAPESEEHIYLKTIVAKAAQEIGWRAITEYRGATPLGEPWIADVYCKSGDEVRVFEIQLANQAPEEFVRRQSLYSASGIKCLWLASTYNSKRICSSIDMPVFRVAHVGERLDPMVSEFQLPITKFVGLVLSGKLKWGGSPVEIQYVESRCWQCEKQIFPITGWCVAGKQETIYGARYSENCLRDIREKIGNRVLIGLGLTPIEDMEKLRPHASVAAVNSCGNCGAFQNMELVRRILDQPGKNCGAVEYRPLNDGTAHWKLDAT